MRKNSVKFIIKKLIIISTLIGLSSCSSIKPESTSGDSNTKKDTVVESKIDRNNFSGSIKANKKTIFLDIKNISEHADLDVSKNFADSLRNKGFTITDNPKNAQLKLTAKILKIKQDGPASADVKLADLGSDIGGLAGGEQGALIGKLAGSLADGGKNNKPISNAELGENIGGLVKGAGSAKTGKIIGQLLDASNKNGSNNNGKEKKEIESVCTSETDQPQKANNAENFKKIGAAFDGKNSAKTAEAIGAIVDAKDNTSLGKSIGYLVNNSEKDSKTGETIGAIADAKDNRTLGKNIGALTGDSKTGERIGGLVDAVSKFAGPDNVTFTMITEVNINELSDGERKSKKGKKTKKGKKSTSSKANEYNACVTTTAINEKLQYEDAKNKLSESLVNVISDFFSTQ